MDPKLLSDLINLLADVSERLDDYVDVVDGDYGESRPNWAMRMKGEVDEMHGRVTAALRDAVRNFGGGR